MTFVLCQGEPCYTDHDATLKQTRGNIEILFIV